MSQAAEEHTAAPSLASHDETREKVEADDGGVAEKGGAEVPRAPKPDFPEGGLRGWATLLGA